MDKGVCIASRVRVVLSGHGREWRWIRHTKKETRRHLDGPKSSQKVDKQSTVVKQHGHTSLNEREREIDREGGNRSFFFLWVRTGQILQGALIDWDTTVMCSNRHRRGQ
jgi:hypothetical protein